MLYELAKIENEISVEDFDIKWTLMKTSLPFNEKNLKYLDILYNLREKWASPFLRSRFTADTTTTQCAESMNNKMKRYLSAQTHLPTFLQEFEKSLTLETEKEEEANVHQLSTTPTTLFQLQFEIEAAEILTRYAFKLFEEQLEQGILKYKILSTEYVSTYVILD